MRPGFSAWPLFKTEARVVGVMHEGYRCAAPRAVPAAGPVRIALTPALDDLDRRESCRPVTAERGEATAYMDAWRTLFADAGAQAPSESDRQVERLLAARAALGFGENCAGPVTDLAVAPGGARAAWRVAGQEGARLRRIELATGAQHAIDAPASGSPSARLAWVAASELVLDRARRRARGSAREVVPRGGAVRPRLVRRGRRGAGGAGRRAGARPAPCPSTPRT